ncbi:MAG: hypothetical protein GF416_06680 [Candidatus Altiarchaeales archaeon]|nr:hypothetical protein [Candidatus Altiarchaeales archaeon]MBD3416798.1 hypothetical protein [Candidatus Altiarchaeales archaeon]
MQEKILKIIVGVSVIALVVVSILFFQNNNTLMFFISIAANFIQILLFITWYFQENPIPKKTITQIDEIHQATKIREEKYKRKEIIITRLMKEGLIREYDLKKIFQSLKNREVFLIHTYGEGVPENLRESYKGESQPLITILTKIGFVRVFGQHNLFIIFRKNLPRSLRSLQRLEEFLLKEVEKVWEKIGNYTREKYPGTDYKIYEKWRTNEGFKCSYLIFKAVEEDFIVGYKTRYSFTPQFVNSIIREIEIEKIKPLIDNRVKLQEFVTKTSIEIFLEDFPKDIKKAILNQEQRLKSALEIKNFTDFKNFTCETLTQQFNKLIGANPEWDKYSELIITQAKEFYDILYELGMEA